MRGLCCITGIEGTQHDRIALVHQRIEQRHFLSGALHCTGFGKVTETPRGIALL